MAPTSFKTLHRQLMDCIEAGHPPQQLTVTFRRWLREESQRTGTPPLTLCHTLTAREPLIAAFVLTTLGNAR